METAPSAAYPGLLAMASFFARSKALQAKRVVKDAFVPLPRLREGTPAEFPFVLAESTSTLNTCTDPREHPLLLGKIQNLRLACRRIHHRVLLPGEVFSFWRQVGAPWGLRGFAIGREVREGCVIPTRGGGLCQLSGSLLDVATALDCELVERHRHTALPADIPYHARRDATLFWNYVDLRFRTSVPILFEACLTRESLTVKLRGKAPRIPMVPIEDARVLSPPLQIGGSCYSCLQTDCARHVGEPGKAAQNRLGKTAFLLDEFQPEFDGYVHAHLGPGDHLLMPYPAGDERHVRSANPQVRTQTFPSFRIRRSWKLRSAVSQGITVAKAHFELAEAAARIYSRRIRYDVEHLAVAQTFLPHLWRVGLLGGRAFDVLMYRLPVRVLERELDKAAHLYPQSRTLAEFRAPSWFAEAEEEALAAARTIVTPHPQIAALFTNVTRLAWERPTQEAMGVDIKKQKDMIVFLGPTLARKGAYAVREIVKQMGFELTVVGAEFEGEDFWRGLPITHIPFRQLPWHRIHTVLQPALFEYWPRQLLRAHAAGSRLVISPFCGIEEDRTRGIYQVPFGDTSSAVAVMETLMASRGGLQCA
jgi:hypothetical protein